MALNAIVEMLYNVDIQYYETDNNNWGFWVVNCKYRDKQITPTNRVRDGICF
jgi:hypothetical protein